MAPAWSWTPLRRQLRTCGLTLAWTHLFWTKCYAVGDTLGASMLPTINVSGDWIVVSKLHARGGRGAGPGGLAIRVGDLVSYAHPVDGPDVHVVKRVVGLPGDFVVVDPTDGSGDMLQVCPPPAPSPCRVANGVGSQVPKGHMWTTGDNLPHSLDSRSYGPVPLALVRGKVIARGQPWAWIRNPLQQDQ